MLQARGQAADLFGKALVEYQIGNSQVLLGYYEEAADSYRRAYASATDYLLVQGTPVRSAWDEYRKQAGSLAQTKMGAKSVVASGIALEAFGPAAPFYLTAIAAGGVIVYRQ